MLNISSRILKAKKHREQMNGIKVLHTPRAAKILVRWIMLILGVLIIVLFLPWQQNITADGSVTAFSPEDRPQSVETAIAGRIERWYFQEGEFVNEGDTLVRLSEIRPEYFDPQIVQRLGEQVDALQERIQAGQERIGAVRDQITSMREAQRLETMQQRNRIEQARFRLEADSADLTAARVNYTIAEQQFERQERLYNDGLISLRELEDARIRLQETRARLSEAENRYETTLNEIMNARIQLRNIQAQYSERINNALASLSQAQADVQASIQNLAGLETQMANIMIRQEQQFLRAPQSGFIVQAARTGIGETVSEGEALLSIMPDNPELAVELYIRPMDVPWIRVGKKARVEFDGWPAIQLPGRPEFAVGTFGGIVRVIDRVRSHDRGGMFRVLVTEDLEDDPWPRELGIGTGVYAWILLDNVPIYFEIWRQLNGFPPTLEDDPFFNVGEQKIRR
jgi:membrane fusion protein, adhesin transport system